jgi:4-hydroxythreonine-4-phosphate dehydrogenase
VRAHAPSAEGGRAQIAALERAVADVREGWTRALVTGPTSKKAVSEAGVRFRGQTEHLAGLVGLLADEVTMLFLGPKLRTGLVTTHHAVRDVPGEITVARVVRTAIHLAHALFALEEAGPRIVVAGLNPHAGEGGLFGDEESRVLVPAIAKAREVSPFVEGQASLEGPTGAETAFRLAANTKGMGVVAMMHDQATIAAKLVDWGASVNVTWGLPFIRTSVDHGVAYDAARRGEADAEGMVAAVQMAQRLSSSRGHG